MPRSPAWLLFREKERRNPEGRAFLPPLPSLFRKETASSRHRPSKAPPPIVPARRPDSSTVIMAPAERGVDPLEETTDTRTRGRPPAAEEIISFIIEKHLLSLVRKKKTQPAVSPGVAA